MSLVSKVLTILILGEAAKEIGKSAAEIVRAKCREEERKHKEAEDAQQAWIGRHDGKIHYNLGNRPLPTGEERVRLAALTAEADARSAVEAEALRKILKQYPI